MKLLIISCLFLCSSCEHNHYNPYHTDEQYEINRYILVSPLIEQSGISTKGQIVPDQWAHKDMLNSSAPYALATNDSTIFINPRTGLKIRVVEPVTGKKIRDPRTKDILIIP